MKLFCPIERQRLTNGRINLVKQKQALLRPKGRTAKVKYLTTLEKGQAKPKYFWCKYQHDGSRTQGPCEKPTPFL